MQKEKQQSFWNNLKDVFKYNPATLSGALDVILSKDKDGNFKSSEFHLRLGKFKVFIPRDKVIDIYINEKKAKYSMKLSQQGIAYFQYYSNDESTQCDSDFLSDFQSEDDDQKDLEELENLSQDEKQSCNKQNTIQSQNTKLSDTQYISYDDSTLFQSVDDIKDGDEIEEVKLSLCASYMTQKDLTTEDINKIFTSHEISYKDFDQNPHKILKNPELMVKIGDKIYESYLGIPQLLSILIYNKELTPFSLQKMANLDIQKDLETKLEKLKNNNKKKKIKSLKPPKDFWDDLDIKEGINILRFVFQGNLNQAYDYHSRVFYYSYKPYRRVIVSDIDGTVTRSDVLGHLMPFISKDWSHIGIAKFFTQLSERGYVIIYLTARNIGQAKKTLNYLESIQQDNYKMPIGPLFTSPDSLFESFKREMIVKNPEVFKIRTLRTIQDIFGHKNYNPIFAGFGNKDTDAIAYSVIGLDLDNIYTISPHGNIYILGSDHTYTYNRLNDFAEQFFPEYNPNKKETYEYGDTHFWGENKKKLTEDELLEYLKDTNQQKIKLFIY